MSNLLKDPILGPCPFGREEQERNTIVQHVVVGILYYQNVPILYSPISHGRFLSSQQASSNPYTHNPVWGPLHKTSHFTFGPPLLWWFLYYRLYTMTCKSDTCRVLAWHWAWIGLGKDWFAQCHDNTTEWDIVSWCRQLAFSVRQHYTLSMSVLCHKSLHTLLCP